MKCDRSLDLHTSFALKCLSSVNSVICEHLLIGDSHVTLLWQIWTMTVWVLSLTNLWATIQLPNQVYYRANWPTTRRNHIIIDITKLYCRCHQIIFITQWETSLNYTHHLIIDITELLSAPNYGWFYNLL